MQDEVYRYSLLLHVDSFSVIWRGKSRRSETVALRVAVRHVTVHSAVRRVLHDSLSMGGMGKFGGAASRPRGYAPDAGHLFRGVGDPGFPIRPWPACQSAGTSLLRRTTGELQRDHRGAIVPMARDSVVLVSNSSTWWPVSSNETAALTG